jgi:hypothetical protein
MRVSQLAQNPQNGINQSNSLANQLTPKSKRAAILSNSTMKSRAGYSNNNQIFGGAGGLPPKNNFAYNTKLSTNQ